MSNRVKPKAILTFDLEFWYNSNFLKKHAQKDAETLEDYIEESVGPILESLKNNDSRATFFVLGQVAEKYPEIIKKIAEHGHEIASHGYSHKPLYELDNKSFEQEIALSKNILKNIINKEPKGFRAPNFSLNKKTNWALEILDKHNFQYGSNTHPLTFSKINHDSLLEIPPSLGGIYFRIIPLWLYVFLIKHFSKAKIPVLFFHPYELFESAPKIKSAPWYKKIIKYWGTKNAWKKFEKLIKRFDCISIEEYLKQL